MRELSLKDIIRDINDTMSEQDQKNLEALADLNEPNDNLIHLDTLLNQDEADEIAEGFTDDELEAYGFTF